MCEYVRTMSGILCKNVKASSTSLNKPLLGEGQGSSPLKYLKKVKKRWNKSETVWCYEDRNVKGSLERTFSKRRYEGKESNNQTLISALRSDTRLDPTEISPYVSFRNHDLYDANINMFVIPYVRVFFFFFVLFYKLNSLCFG